MARGLSECLLVLALLVVGQVRASAQARVYVLVRDPVAAVGVPASVVQSGRAELEGLVRARPGMVLGNGVAARGAPSPYAGLRAYAVQARLLSVSASSASSRMGIAIEVTDLTSGRTIVSATGSTNGPAGMALVELFDRALRSLWGSIASQLRP